MDKKSGVDITKDTFEFVLDQVSNNEIVKDIPVVNTVANIVALSRSIPDYLFTRKLTKFLNCLDDVSPKDRERLREAAIDDKKINTLAEHVMNCLQKASDDTKAEFIACLFLAYSDSAIDAAGFRRALDLVDLIFVDDLIYFANCFGSIPDSDLHEEKISDLMPSIVGSALIQRRTEQRERYSPTGQRILSRPVLEIEISTLGQQVIDAYAHGMRLRRAKGDN